MRVGIAGTGKMGSATVTPAACSAGFTYKYTFTATDGNRDSSDDVTVTVAQ